MDKSGNHPDSSVMMLNIFARSPVDFMVRPHNRHSTQHSNHSTQHNNHSTQHNDASACRHAHEQLSHAVQQAVDQNAGNECLLLIVDSLQQEAAELVQAAQDHADAESISSQEQLNLNSTPMQLGRRSIWYPCWPCSCSARSRG